MIYSLQITHVNTNTSWDYTVDKCGTQEEAVRTLFFQLKQDHGVWAGLNTPPVFLPAEFVRSQCIISTR